ncbi:Protein LURP-one-related 7 [Acorus gramineus]|uniref:Protein LURP-one-related 7 n=1 Tax=Acorus gramineus TaxID=55184 RepID=A0AAV9ANF1_ACOGR|nr:Protein LURP-one-related 7 [Acorus gramineus]
MVPFDYPANPPIPVDFTITKGRLSLILGDLTVYDARGDRVFSVDRRRLKSGDADAAHTKALVDSAGNPLITLHFDGGWKGFRGNSLESKDLIFRVQTTVHSRLRTEMEVFLMGENGVGQKPDLIIKGSPYKRSCTIYMGSSIIAQTSLMYKLGKIIYGRRKFRLTVYPGADHVLVVALLVVFFQTKIIML